jgi:hypothetical protein
MSNNYLDLEKKNTEKNIDKNKEQKKLLKEMFVLTTFGAGGFFVYNLYKKYKKYKRNYFL